MESVVINLINELERELTQTKKGMFSYKSLVDVDTCLDILDELRESLPTEIERAQNIMKERRQILIDAEEEAKQCHSNYCNSILYRTSGLAESRNQQCCPDDTQQQAFGD